MMVEGKIVYVWKRKMIVCTPSSVCGLHYKFMCGNSMSMGGLLKSVTLPLKKVCMRPLRVEFVSTLSQFVATPKFPDWFDWSVRVATTTPTQVSRQSCEEALLRLFPSPSQAADPLGNCRTLVDLVLKYTIGAVDE